MRLPDFMMALPAVDLPFPESQVEGRAVRSGQALVIFFLFHEDTELPAHAHGPQWGTLLQGEMRMKMHGQERIHRPGDAWDVPAGRVHSVRVAAGSIAIDVFDDPDRYPLKR